jgi:GT2 family glycosyltransferase
VNQLKNNCIEVPLISIVVLNYNGLPWLERCLGSLRRQTIYDRLEVIVADNASPDRSIVSRKS